MTKARLIKYVTNSYGPSGPSESDITHLFAKAVYVSDERILVRRRLNSDSMLSSISQIYEALIGKEAVSSYKKELKKFRGMTYRQRPETIEVSEEFVNWARAMHQAQNPAKEISDLLNPYS